MNTSQVNTEKWWCKPPLTVTGQTAFWNGQAEIYETADMTVDNAGEMDVVLRHCRFPFESVVTLGGAVGCRDPRKILEDLIQRAPGARPRVFFNDLAERLVLRAKSAVLTPFAEQGFSIKYHVGEIRRVCEKIPRAPRRIIIGVYEARSFFLAHPTGGHPQCGFSEYVKNSAILGKHFLFDWVRLNDAHGLESAGLRGDICVEDSSETLVRVKRLFAEIGHKVWTQRLTDIAALQVIGRTDGRKGFFISHWYTPSGVRQLLLSAFPKARFSIRRFIVSKGSVFVIDPRGTKPCGVVTVLNNVIGNVLPHDQYRTLCAIRDTNGPDY